MLVLCAAGYLYAFPYFPAVNNPNENVRFYMTAAMVDEGTYAIDAPRQRWGWVNDAACVERRPGREPTDCARPPSPEGTRHYYSVKAPGTSFLGVPAYALARVVLGPDADRAALLWAARVGGTILPWLLFLAVLYGLLGRWTSSALLRDAVFASVAFGSCAFAYGMLFVSHVQSAAALFGAFILLWDARRGGGRIHPARAALAGLLTASVTLFEYPGLIASVGLSLYACLALTQPRRPWSTARSLAAFALGALGPTLLMMHVQWACFGAVHQPGHPFMESPSFRANHQQGLFGATELHPEALFVYFLHPGKGLFPLTPLLLGALWGFVRLARRRPVETGLVLGIIALTTLAVAFQIHWTGGWVIGPRYLLFAYPFFAWATLRGLTPVGRRAPIATGAVAIGLTAVGLLMSGLPSVYFPHYPERLAQPVPQIVALLVAHDYAPYNALNLLGVYGTASMAPLYVAFAGLLLALGWAAGRGRRGRALAIGAVVALVVGGPLAWDYAPGDPEVREDRAYVTRRWAPAGHDRAARLGARLEEDPDPAGFARLADLYRTEGRDREARRARRRARRLAR